MRVLAEGCEYCNVKLRRSSDRRHENHYGANLGDDARHLGVRAEGQEIKTVLECIVGTPGKAIQATSPPRVCDCRPRYMHDANGLGAIVETLPLGVFVQLVEYDSLEVFSVTQAPVG